MMKNQIYTALLAAFSFLILVFPSFAQEKFGGVSLYTVRNEMGKDPKGTLAKVAEIGYKNIESADYRDGNFYGLTPEEFNKTLSDLGMSPLSAHMGSANLDNIDKHIADAKSAGFKYLVAPVPPMGLFKYDPATKSLSMSEDLDQLVSILKTMGEKCKAAGIEFLYHNHGFEFEKNSNGIVPIEYMLEKLVPSVVNFQIDLYWVAKAGADPVVYFKKYPGRFPIWHLKDMDAQGRFAPVGTGSIDFKKIQKQMKKAGMKYYLVEQDQTFDGMEPLEAIRISHGNLKKFGFN
ncbi:sugar phosphate isomerase/epimerase family protein [Shivajiella indica]|uniref:Sugar phosphate isomerase/epimerase family protein n=1 Tax=Shivajiella indica TaxID=872115 RepID=A0ABW5B679_9BACT